MEKPKVFIHGFTLNIHLQVSSISKCPKVDGNVCLGLVSTHLTDSFWMLSSNSDIVLWCASVSALAPFLMLFLDLFSGSRSSNYIIDLNKFTQHYQEGNQFALLRRYCQRVDQSDMQLSQSLSSLLSKALSSRKSPCPFHSLWRAL